MASKQLVEHGAKSVNVRRTCELAVVSNCLFRRHVTWRAQNFQRARDGAFCLDKSRQAEVGKMRFARCIEQNVARFDVAMENAAFMRVMNGARHLRYQFRGAPDWH